jgi:DMSO/TMAO reductase YedYZ molybdopterin-dependent catalytic subunit
MTTNGRRAVGAATGVLTLGVALAAGHLTAALSDPAASPVLAVGQAFIDRTPEWLKSWAIETFGANDKRVLLGGIALVLIALAILAGVAGTRRPAVAYGGLAVLTGVGVAAALSRPGATIGWALPPMVAGLAGTGSYAVLTRATRAPQAAAGSDEVSTPVEMPSPDGFDRRRFLTAAVALGATATVGGGLARALERRSVAEAARNALGVPSPTDPAAALSEGAQLVLPGLSPFFTPNDRFYRVDTTLLVPKLGIEDWSLRIHGMVDRPLTLRYRDLLDRPLIERDVTLTCVSNEVGGSYVGNARWIGTALAPILEEAGVRPGADQILSTSADGMTIGTPTAQAIDGRDAMLAIAMNGEPLPFAHGFPVRMVIPGLYGYESATKWVVDLELTTFDDLRAYWVKRGWAERVAIKTSSRIDTPRNRTVVTPGPVTIAGVAWAQHRGIERVEVRIDGGAWTAATLAEEATPDTWRQWRLDWEASPGEHTIEVRAADGNGALQTERRADPFPSGATGYHTITVLVEA